MTFSKRHSIATISALLALCVLMIIGFFLWTMQPVNKNNNDEIQIVIPKGSSVSDIGEILHEKGVIRSSLIFKIVVKQSNLQNKLQAGSFTLSPSLKLKEIINRLTQGTNDIWVTVKEGWRAEEIGYYLDSQLENFSVQAETYQDECLAYEGQLFPETYLVPKEYSTSQMCQLLRNQYAKVATSELLAAWASHNLTPTEGLTLASIVEREAKSATDKKKVAGVLYNRLEIGMPLQVDATLQYIKGYNVEKQTWWDTPTATDKQLNSLYNTYLNPGLPPGPIANPGLDSLQAVADPINTTALYYISNSDGSQMFFADTYEEHQANITRHLR